MTEAGDVRPGGPCRTKQPLPSAGREEQNRAVEPGVETLLRPGLVPHRLQRTAEIWGAMLHGVTKASLKVPKVTASVPWI